MSPTPAWLQVSPRAQGLGSDRGTPGRAPPLPAMVAWPGP